MFLASLKCGGVGLNLTMAQKVVIVDPWWNWAIEQQAFGRIFRIGQQQQTALLRIFANDTIDRRLYEMQAAKNEKINAVMAPGVQKEREKLNINDLLKLFGNVEEQESGDIFIIPDDQPKRSAVFDDNAYLQWDKPE